MCLMKNISLVPTLRSPLSSSEMFSKIITKQKNPMENISLLLTLRGPFSSSEIFPKIITKQKNYLSIE